MIKKVEWILASNWSWISYEGTAHMTRSWTTVLRKLAWFAYIIGSAVSDLWWHDLEINDYIIRYWVFNYISHWSPIIYVHLVPTLAPYNSVNNWLRLNHMSRLNSLVLQHWSRITLDRGVGVFLRAQGLDKILFYPGCVISI